MATRTDASLATLSDKTIRSLIEVGRALSDEPDLSVAFERVADIVRSVIPYDRFSIAATDHSTGTIGDPYIAGRLLDGEAEEGRVPIPGTIFGYLMDYGETLLHDEVSMKARLARIPRLDRIIGAGLRSGISVPLRSQNMLVGAIHVWSAEDRSYASDEKRLLEAIGHQLAGPVASEQLRLRLEQSALEGSVLAEMSRILTSGLQIQEMYEQIGEQVKRLVPYQRLVIAVADPESGTGRDLYVTGAGSSDWSSRESSLLSETMTGYMSREVKAIYLFEGEESFAGVIPSEDRHRESLGLAALISVPIIDKGKLIGNLNVRERELSAYTLNDVRKMERVATQIAGTLANQELQDSIARQAAEREVLAEIGRTINSTLRLEEVLERFAVQARKLIPFDRIVISQVDADTDNLLDTHVSGREVEGYFQGARHSLSSNVTSQAVLSGRPIAWNRDALDVLAADKDPAADALNSGLNSLLIAPLIWQGGVVGTVNFRSELPDPYGPDEIRLAEEIGAQIAGAITTTRLYAESERESDFREGLAEIGRIMTSSLDASEVFPRCSNQIGRMIPFDRLAIVLVDEIAGTKTDAYSAGIAIPGQEPGVVTPLASSFAEEIIKNGEPRLIGAEELADRAERFPGTRARVDHGLNSLIAVPLVWRGRTIGILNIRSKQDAAYGPGDVELAGLIAAQIAGSVATSALYAESEREAEIRKGLTAIAVAAASDLQLEQILESVAGQLTSLVPYDRMTVTLLDAHDPLQLRIAFAHGVEISGYAIGDLVTINPDGEGQPWPWRSGLETDLGGKGGPAFLRKAGKDLGFESRMEVPLGSPDRGLTGYLGLRIGDSHEYSSADLEVLKRVAAQISPSIDNSRLHEQLQADARERELLAEISRVIGASVDLSEMFAQIKGLARELLPVDGFGIATIDSESGTFEVLDLDTGEGDTPIAGNDGAPQPLEDSFAGEAFKRVETVIYCPEDPDEAPKRYPRLSGIHKIGGRSFMATPLVSKGETLGVLLMYSKALNAFSNTEKNIAERFANQIAGKIEVAALVADVTKLAATVDASPDFISLSNSDFQIEYTNPAGLDLMGMLPIDESEVVRAPDLFTSEDGERLANEGLAQALSVGFWWAELEALRMDGSHFPVEALLVPIKDSGGEVQALSLQFRDISRRVAVQNILAESEQHYRDLFENAEDMIQTADPEGNLLYVNRAWRRRLGYQSDEVSSMTIWDVVHPDSQENCRAIFARILAGESVGEFDTVFATKLGQKVFVRGTANCGFDDGRPISTRGIFRDVGARLEVERMKDEFVSMVSHELRTPLTSIRGSLGMLASGLLKDRPEQAQRMLEIASSNTDRLVRLINDILDIERIESRAIEMDMVAVDALSVIEQAAEEMQSLADEAAVRIEIRSGTAWVMADHDRVVQTLTNLVSNAIKFSDPDSTVTIECRQGDDKVTFSVSDSGRGIPPEKIDTIFERFQQVDSSDSRDRGGTGLGLAICRLIVEQHGGEISVGSEMGVGSTFDFWLNRALNPAVAAESQVSDAGVAGDE